MAQAYRCSTCNTDWPNTYVYAKCPECGEPTWTLNDAEPLSFNEAAERVKAHQATAAAEATAERERSVAHEKFEKWYAERAAAELRSDLANWAALG